MSDREKKKFAISSNLVTQPEEKKKELALPFTLKN
jgi:hypothetical protein